MNISGTSNCLPSLPPVKNTSVAPIGVDAGGDAGSRPERAHHGGGHMRQALVQALQSIGVSMPQPAGAGTSGSTSVGASSVRADSDGDRDGDRDGPSPSGVGSVKQDMQQFMHALFQAVRSESDGNSTASSAGADPASGFSAGLSALIAQVGNGSAPSGLQDAFTKLMSDLQGAANAGGTSNATAVGTAGASVSLQDLLTKLQQNIGYGASATPSTGNIVSTRA